MKPELQQRIQRYGWDKAAAYYENSWQTQLKPAQDLLLDMAEVQVGETVLDIAAGTGLVTYRLREEVGPTGYVLGTDISDEMVNMSNAVVESRGLKNVSFERMAAEKLSCESAQYDLAISSLGMMYVSDVPGSFAEMYRCLKPNGRAVIAVWGARSNCGWAEIFPIVDCRVKTDVCPLFFNLGNGNALSYIFEHAGFSQVKIERIETILEYSDGEVALEAAFKGGPVALAYAKFDEATRNEAEAEYLRSIESFRKGKKYFIPGEFVVARGFKI